MKKPIDYEVFKAIADLIGIYPYPFGREGNTIIALNNRIRLESSNLRFYNGAMLNGFYLEVFEYKETIFYRYQDPKGPWNNSAMFYDQKSAMELYLQGLDILTSN